MPSRAEAPNILIAGLGNEILTDDGVGVHAARALQNEVRPGVCVAEVGTAVLDALHLIEWADAILALDAMQAGGPPGSIYLCEAEGIAKRGAPASLHELDLLSALHFLPDHPQPEVVVLGMEPAVIDYGLELSPAVEAALGEYVQRAREIAAEWAECGNAATLQGE